MDDLEAITRCRAGDHEAFRHLVGRYQAEAIGHACAILGRREDAADAAQDAFFSAFRALDRFDDQRRFYPWFYTILRNRCLSMLADRTAHLSATLDGIELLAAVPGVAPDDLLALEEALRALSPDEREILTLRHLDGLSYAELAELLAVPQGTVMSRLFNARKRLRDSLGKEADR